MRTTLALVLLCAASGSIRADEPPTLRYPAHRASARWIELPTGVSVAVDQGVTWQRVTVYLSLTNELVATDAASGKVLWARHVGAFWNEIAFAETPRGEGKVAWSVELRPDPRERVGRDERACYDLVTGAPDAPAAAEPGAAIAVARAWSGEYGRIALPLVALATSAGHWERAAKLVFAGAPPVAAGAVDFTREVVLIVAAGPSSNCRGFAIDSVRETEGVVRVRIHAHTFQTMGGGVATNPWGVFVLPRRAKAYRIERNAQRYLGGPPLWTPWIELASLEAAATQLAERLGDRPAASERRYY